ncbi:MAG: hypothetical protein HFG70_14345 [Hungatella sp.]|nr:hypothetical protein [Hungatella sp.]
MAYYKICPKCKAHLDPEEHCTCEEEAKREAERVKRLFKKEPGSNQITFNWLLERERV